MARSGTCDDLNGSAGLMAQAVRQRLYPLQSVIDALHFAEQRARLGGLSKPPFHAMEQGEAQLIFGVKQDLADCRLRDAQQAGCAADAPSLHDRMKDLDLAQIYGSFLHLGRPVSMNDDTSPGENHP